MNDSLFGDFQGVSFEQWKQQAIKDLKGKDFEESLVWHTLEGVAVAPYYSSEGADNQALEAIRLAQYKAKSGWENREILPATDAKWANQQGVEALKNGADALLFDLSRQPLANISVKHLLDKIKLAEHPVYFKLNHQTVELSNTLLSILGYYPKGGIYDDPIAQWMTDGDWHEDAWTQLAVALRSTAHWPHFKVVGIDGSVFHQAGASVVQEIAFTLASAITHLDKLSDEGLAPHDVANKMELRLSVGTDYFIEIAKIRALRYLWLRIAQEWGFEVPAAVYATSSLYNTAAVSPYTNMLRATTEAMSAVVGGCNALSVLPYDAAFGDGSEFSRRIARNVPLVLREESYLDKTLDPAAGSYYLEQLTLMLAEQSWALLGAVEEQGGLIAAFEQNFVQTHIRQAHDAKLQRLHSGVGVMVGVNKFRHDDTNTPSVADNPPPPLGKAAIELLPSLRLSAELERTK
jgi:methylmalonyl-CoA mutase